MKHKVVSGQKIICLNRKASFNYFFLELLEAGIVLKGSEVKSLRDGKGSIADSYALDNNGELYLINSHIPLYRQSSYNNHDPKGDRKLLLNMCKANVRLPLVEVKDTSKKIISDALKVAKLL